MPAKFDPHDAVEMIRDGCLANPSKAAIAAVIHADKVPEFVHTLYAELNFSPSSHTLDELAIALLKVKPRRVIWCALCVLIAPEDRGSINWAHIEKSLK